MKNGFMKTLLGSPVPLSRYLDARSCLLLAGALLMAAWAFREPLTATMTRHMFVHIPLLLLCGLLLGRVLALRGEHGRGGRLCRVLSHYRQYDEFGVPGLLLASFAGACWMVPRTLDLVLASGWADFGKFVSLLVVGMVLYDSLCRANVVIKLFFLGNFCWMAAVVGMVYQNNTARLCNYYLLGDQELAGIGLVVLAVALPVLWGLAAHRRVRRFMRM
jgi:hypothetical protein